ncbi:beta strand repeat-containing protein, partial [Marinobacter sp. F3R08]|uniref:beta strand repeat-containing protein n=1 Tax=Marinobacter sp. F3R08 TaxID=2841559 RepID=UPI001C08E095
TGTLDVFVDSVDNTNDTVDLSGTTEDVAPGNSVTITITDADGTVVNTSAIVANNGSYSVSGVDVSTLIGGTFTVSASATDRNGNAVSDSETGTLNGTVSDLTLTIVDADNTDGIIDLSGTTTDVVPGATVTITITDADGTVVNTSAIVANDGSYSVTGVDVSSLVDGSVTVNASAIDQNGDPVSDSGSSILDATTGTLDVSVDSVDNTNDTVELSGTTEDVAPGNSVTITITDADGTVVNTSAIVANNGSYSVSGVDVSTLIGGTFTVNASATDRNGDPVSDTTAGTLEIENAPDALADTYKALEIDGLFGEYYAYQQGSDADGDNLSSLAQVESFVNANNPDATFVGTNVDYGSVSGNLGNDGRLQTFLGSDASSLSNDPENSSDGIIRLTGELELAPGTYQFQVRADDGYRIEVNGETVAISDRNQGATTRTGTEFTLTGDGPHTVEVIYWDQGGKAELGIDLRPADGTYEVFGSSHASYTGENPALIVDVNESLSIAPSVLLANDSDADGDPLTIQSVQNPANGTVSIDASGNVVFTPDAGFTGEGSFTYTVSDGNGGTDSATVTVAVNPVAGTTNINVQASDTAVTEDDASNNTASGTVSVSNADGSEGAVNSSTANHGSVNVDANGNWTYSLDNTSTAVQALKAGETLTDTITFTSNDGTNTSQDITITGTNDTPTASNVDLGSMTEDTGSFLITEAMLADGITEVDSSEAVSAQNLSLTTGNGSLVDNSDGTWTFTPDADWDGQVHLAYDYTSGAETGSNTASMTVIADADTPELTLTSETVSPIDGSPEASLPVSTGLLLNIYEDLNNGDRDASTQEPAIGTNTPTESNRVIDGFGTTKEQSSGSFSNDGSTIEVSTGNTVSVTGLIYLEAGHSYQFQGYRDDSLRIELGGKTLISTTGNSWGNYGADASAATGSPLEGDSFEPTESGFYTLEVYANNVSGPGQLSLNLSVDGQQPQELNAENFNIYSSVSDLVAVGGQFGDFNPGTDNPDGGYFPLTINSGVKDTYIEIANIAAAVTDTDGSESITALRIGNIPAGAVLTDGENSFTANLGLIPVVDVLSWDLNNIQILPPTGFTGSIDLTVTATSEEASNADQASASQTLTVHVQELSELLGTIDPDLIGTDTSIHGTSGNDTITATNGDDIILAGAGDDTVNALDGVNSIDGGAGNDTITDGAGTSVINGGLGNDTLIGGAGSDVLTGGFGADVFRWELGDENDADLPRDVVTDFTIDSTNGFTGTGDGDQLALDDLLQGATEATVTDFLMAQEENGDTVLYMNKDGALADTVDNAQQSIVLSGVSMDGQTSEQFIDSLVNSGHIKVE